MEQGKGGTLITLTGNRSAVVDGCDGIIDYDAEKILLRAGRLTVRFGGRDLALRRLTENSAVIEGFISQVERDITSLSISTLMDVLECLGTNLKDFFSD